MKKKLFITSELLKKRYSIRANLLLIESSKTSNKDTKGRTCVLRLVKFSIHIPNMGQTQVIELILLAKNSKEKSLVKMKVKVLI